MITLTNTLRYSRYIHDIGVVVKQLQIFTTQIVTTNTVSILLISKTAGMRTILIMVPTIANANENSAESQPPT
jgi:uncharacterized membrane protein YidH (DUF202 family)